MAPERPAGAPMVLKPPQTGSPLNLITLPSGPQLTLTVHQHCYTLGRILPFPTIGTSKQVNIWRIPLEIH